MVLRRGYGTIPIAFHPVQGFVMFVSRVGTLYVNDGMVRTETSQGVNMAVCIVAGQIAVFQPKYLAQVKSFFQVIFDVCP